MPQSEQQLENNLISQLEAGGYECVVIPDETALRDNLRQQLCKHNDIELSDDEWKRVMNHLSKGSVFEKAEKLRDQMQLQRDDGTTAYISFINSDKWCQNEYQVTNQVTVEGRYQNRYDVTLLINGIPMVQIELKRRGVRMKDAFNQIQRYKKHSYGAGDGLFDYVQLFVFSNGANTKYLSNNKSLSYQQTFYWTDDNNQKYSAIEDFAREFLDKCHVSKMITKYIVLAQADKTLMVLRPYQYHAAERILKRVKESSDNGYIWHTTGSGKTLTSFKTSQLLTALPEVHKVVFVVDRRDLDAQTMKEFNSFREGSVEGTANTGSLVKQFSDQNVELILTTVQKLNNAISNSRHGKAMNEHRDKKMVFIFDECHRSQFGQTHSDIKEYFGNTQLFGFTGTPIFPENNINDRTTADLFKECLHKYVITDAINDQNVLPFSVDYVGKYKSKQGKASYLDTEVESIDTTELMEHEDRVSAIVDNIIDIHPRKTYNGDYNAILAVQSTDMAVKYYDAFIQRYERGDHKLKVATIFTYAANPEQSDSHEEVDDMTVLEGGTLAEGKQDKHKRESLEDYIGHYNKEFGTKFSTDADSFQKYYKDVATKVKNRNIDILIVVNMFLTGFDSKTLNTLYVDKNLRYHGLIQAYSRTNRLLNAQKSHGNIVCYRNLKGLTDQAISLYSDKDTQDVILLKPYSSYTEQFNDHLEQLLEFVQHGDEVDALPSEADKIRFVKLFSPLIKLMNTLEVFTDFSFDDLGITSDDFTHFTSKYVDIYVDVKPQLGKDKESIVDDVEFNIELIHRDTINATYILSLLTKMKGMNVEEKEAAKKKLLTEVSTQTDMRSKRELIEKFIDKQLDNVATEDIEDKWGEFWTQERVAALDGLCTEQKLKKEVVNKIISDYNYTEKKPTNSDIIEALEQAPSIKERKGIIESVWNSVNNFLDKFSGF